VKDKYYYKDGSVLNIDDTSKQLHRENGPAVEYPSGYKEWWINNKRHRVNGPAIEWSNGSKFWYIDGKLHRVDGPACEWASGGKEWWVDGKHLTEEEFNNHPQVRHYRFQVLLEEVLSER